MATSRLKPARRKVSAIGRRILRTPGTSPRDGSSSAPAPGVST
jgi:hypothetical protein